MRADLVLLHPPSIFRFRELPIFYGPVSDVIPSSSIFENYPIGFMTLSEYLHRHGVSVRIVNLALKMLRDPRFDPEAFIAGLEPAAFGIDLHWLPHVDGSLGLAAALKRRHPRIPVILGGFSATYYRHEILRDYPDIDFIVSGDSTELPMLRLMEAIKAGGGFEEVPNLLWRNPAGMVVDNGLGWRPEHLDDIRFDYAHLLRMSLKYRDPAGYLPFRNWLANPVTAVFSSRGCIHDCASCGGAASAFRTCCQRNHPVFRTPERLAADIREIARTSGGPIMVIGDLLQAGEEYGERFLAAMRGSRVENQLAIEFFRPPSAAFIRKVADSLVNFNVELSPESHDPGVRRAFGKDYGNAELEAAIEALLASPCRRIDLFFMVGLPQQSRTSVLESVAYCGDLLRRYGGSGRLLPMLAPLAPFIDPGSRIFEQPERFGYRLFCRTLAEHRSAMLTTTWKQRLNYESRWMSRDDIVAATYSGALELTELKRRHGLVEAPRAEQIQAHIRQARDLIERLERGAVIDESLHAAIRVLNRGDTLCDKHELDWSLSGWRLNPLGVLRALWG